MQSGDVAPDFELADDQGQPRTLSGLLADGPVVLFFYPVASSSGCTKESCHFRDLAAEFAAVGAQRVGISSDSVEAQRRFAADNGFDFPLLSDPAGTVAEQYGVRRNMRAAPTKRRTFVIGTDRAILEVVSSELRMAKHADAALQVLRGRAAPA